jgi:hypothetical protein
MTLAVQFVGNQVVFDSEKVAFGCAANCPACTSTPSELVLTATGIANGTCNLCNSYNGEFILTYEGVVSLPSEFYYCWWRYQFPSAPCTNGAAWHLLLHYTLIFGVPANIKLLVIVGPLTSPNESLFWYWEYPPPPPLNCAAWNLDLTWSGLNPVICSLANSAVHIGVP